MKYCDNFNESYQRNTVSVVSTYFVNILFPSPLLNRTTTKAVASSILVA